MKLGIWNLQLHSFPRLFWLYGGPFKFRMIFRVNFSISATTTVGIFIKIQLNLYITLGSIDILTILSLLIQEHTMSLIYDVFNFFKKYFVIFNAQVFHLFGLFIRILFFLMLLEMNLFSSCPFQIFCCYKTETHVFCTLILYPSICWVHLLIQHLAW